jgi:hypothetical protein
LDSTTRRENLVVVDAVGHSRRVQVSPATGLPVSKETGEDILSWNRMV